MFLTILLSSSRYLSIVLEPYQHVFLCEYDTQLLLTAKCGANMSALFSVIIKQYLLIQPLEHV